MHGSNEQTDLGMVLYVVPLHPGISPWLGYSTTASAQQNNGMKRAWILCMALLRKFRKSTAAPDAFLTMPAVCKW